MKSDFVLGHLVFSGAMYTGLFQAIRVLITVCSTIFVARLLTPGDFGVIAMTSPVMAFLLIFQDLGLNQAVVQHESISDEQLNAMFWLNVGGSSCVALLLLALSPGVAFFYHDARAGYVTAAFSSNVVLSGFALQHSALLSRRMRFAMIGMIDVATAGAGLVATVSLAYFLRTYWALWLGMFFSTLLNVVLLWSAVDWRPQMKINFGNTRGLIGFGTNVTIFNVLNFMHRNVDNLLIARVWGATQLGLYDRAYKLMTFPLLTINNPLGRVMVPVLSRLQNEPDRFRRTFLLAIRAILIVSMPGIAVAAATSEQLIPFLLGIRWAAASPIFAWLSLAAATSSVSNATGWLFISCGHTQAYARWGIVSAVLTVCAFLSGLPWGAMGVARAYSICMTIVVPPLLYSWATKGTPVSAKDLYRVMCEPLLAASVTYLFIKVISPHFGIITVLSIGLPISYSLAILFQKLTPTGNDTLNTLTRLLCEIVRKKLNVAPPPPTAHV